MPETETKEFLTLEETARLLGIEAHHVSKLVKAGVIPSVTLSPRVIRVPRRLCIERLEALAGAVAGRES